jgi:hypothetical protein
MLQRSTRHRVAKTTNRQGIMVNPWEKKNPAMSLFLTTTNIWLGAARGIAAAEAKDR